MARSLQENWNWSNKREKLNLWKSRNFELGYMKCERFNRRLSTNNWLPMTVYQQIEMEMENQGLCLG